MSGLEGTLRLSVLAVRRDRLRLLVWLLGLVALTTVAGNAMGSVFPTRSAVDSYADSVGSSPAAIGLSGPPVALHTLAGVVLNKVGVTALVGVALMAVLEVVRHTRAEEEAGRTELLRSAAVGRQAGAAAALLVVSVTSALIGAGIAAGLVTGSVPVSGAVLFGASVAVLGWVFAAVALCLAQVAEHARTVLGLCLVVLGLSFVVRAVGDVRHDGLVWFSPIGWSQATHPLGADRWWPLAVPVVMTVVLLAVAALLSERRDLGAGLVAVRPGPADASGRLAGPVGLAFRLQRGALAGWTVGTLLLALVVGSLTRTVDTMARRNPRLEQYLHATGRGGLVDSYLATMLLVLALLAAVFAVSSAMRPGAEESSGRLEALLATGLSRTRWLLGTLVVTLAGSLLVLVAGGAGLGLAYGLVASDPGQTARLAGLSLSYAPAVLGCAGLAVLLYGWLPRAAPLAWGFLGLCFVLGYFGGLLSPPAWLAALSPFHHLPQVPVEPVSVPAVVLVGLTSVLVTGLGLLGFVRRDVG